MIDNNYPIEVIVAAQARYYREYDYSPFQAKHVDFKDILDQEYKVWQQSHSKNAS